MKKTFQKGSGDNVIKYPITQQQLDSLKPCRLVNPMVGACDYKVAKGFDEVESAFEVLKVVLEVKKDIFPRWFMEKYYPFKTDYGQFPDEIPKLLMAEGLSFGDPKGLGLAVHMDFPCDLGRAMLRWLLSEGYNVKSWTPNHTNFLESVPFIEEQLADATKKALVGAFKGKYSDQGGIRRPEEILEDVTGVPGALFTLYPEGSPNHPSGIYAGHGAAAAAVAKCIIDEFQELPINIEKQIIDSAYIWAAARTLSGVHHWQDNIASLVAFGLESFIKDEIVALFKK